MKLASELRNSCQIIFKKKKKDKKGIAKSVNTVSLKLDDKNTIRKR